MRGILVEILQVTFKSFGPIRRLLQKQVIELEVSEGTNVRQVVDTIIQINGDRLRRLILNEGEISGNLIVLLNKRDAANLKDGLCTVLSDGDEVALLPHVQGG
jgi:MoaD family protein